jgi:DHA2 family multidrug resistance protein
LGLILVWVSALQIVLDKGHELDWFESHLIGALAAVCAAGFMLFLAWEINTDHPIVDLRLFRNRSFLGGVGGLCFGFAALFATMVVQPLWLQTQMGYTAIWAGLVLAPMGILALLFSPLVGVSLARVDARYFATIGLIVLAVAGFIRAGYSTDADYAAIAYPQWITGIGMALLMPPLVTMSLADLSPNKAALGSGMQNFCRMTIGSFAASLAITLWDHRTVLHASALVERLGSFDPGYRNAVDVATAAGLPRAAADAQLAFEVARQASVRGIDDVFWLSAFVFLAAIPIVWIARRPVHATMTTH